MAVVSVPLLVRFPAIVNELAKPPEAPGLTIAPALIIMFPETVNVLAEAVVLYCSMPEVPCPTVRLVQFTEASIVTVAPLAIITSSPAAGAIPPTHVEVALQLPPVPVEVIMPAKERATNKDVKSSK